MDDNTREDEYIKKYDITKYDRPSITTDIVAFTVRNEDSRDYRKLPKKKLSVLLIKRDKYPYKNKWALPGGFAIRTESVEENAYRKLKEKAGIEDIALSQLKVFSRCDRDPRGWIISCAFIALAEENKYIIDKKDMSSEKWFTVTYDEIDNNLFSLVLKNGDDKLSATIKEGDEFSKDSFTIINNDGIAFDHAEIISCAIQKLRRELYDHELAFELVPEYFTLTDLQRVCEIVQNQKLLKPNFRRKIKDLVVETDKSLEGAGHRPARLYSRCRHHND